MANNALFTYPKGRLNWSDVISMDPVHIGTLEQPVLQNTCAIAIGEYSGAFNQGTCAIAIGDHAGFTNQSSEAISIGHSAGFTNQSIQSIAIGSSAGTEFQEAHAIAIGTQAGQIEQGADSVSIGTLSGNEFQAHNSIAIGNQSGRYNQGAYSIAIGNKAAELNQPTNSIVINALPSALNGTNSNACYIKPLRSEISSLPSYYTSYNSITGQLTYELKPICVGDIKYSVRETNHNGWLICHGSSLSKSIYNELYSVIQDKFTPVPNPNEFNLPDTRGRVLCSSGQGVGLSNRITGQTTGAESVTLNVNQIPSHLHTGTTDSNGSHTHSSNANGGYGGYGLCTSNGINTVIDTDNSPNELNVWENPTALTINSSGAHTHSFTTGNTGGGQSHDNMQPTLFVGNVFIYSGIL